MFRVDKPISGVFQFSFLDLELHHFLMVLLCLIFKSYVGLCFCKHFGCTSIPNHVVVSNTLIICVVPLGGLLLFCV
jgi:hypothetical protein